MSDLKSLKLAADTVRLLSADGVQKAKSGHPGMPMGTADLAFTLWYKFLKHNPRNPNWLGRDRFVLSAGHGSMLIYSLLHLFGYGLTMDDLKNFRQWESLTPGHPEYGHTKGVKAGDVWTQEKADAELEKEIRLLKKENDFLEEASAFFAASRLKSAKTKE